MATKKTNKLARDKHTEDISAVSEPLATYSINAAATRSIMLMGMNGRQSFTGIKNESDFIEVIRNGIPKQAMMNLMQVAGLSLLEMAAIIHTSDRTLRRYTPAQKLSQEQSERMVEMARLYSRGEEVFGTMDAFREWMDTMLLQFGNKKPKDYLDTSLGINMIMDELGRIQHGIFA
ncbi:MAG: antitoxin Xre-like helix-turn-helix domain-containing protein [Bacteroidota bacterium]